VLIDYITVMPEKDE
jgi:hypothetical protein